MVFLKGWARDDGAEREGPVSRCQALSNRFGEKKAGAV